MRAVRLAALDTPPSLKTTRPPEPSEGEVVLDVAACGLNFADLLMMTGKYQERPALPFTMGLEVAGRVTSPILVCAHAWACQQCAVPISEYRAEAVPSMVDCNLHCILQRSQAKHAAMRIFSALADKDGMPLWAI